MSFRENSCRPARLIVAGLTLLALTGCTKKSGEAIVLEKEHIAAIEIRETPSAAPLPSDTSAPSPGATPAGQVETARELRPDEIAVGGYVMEKSVRGTSKDPRATADEQWSVRLELVSGRRKIDLRTDRAQYEKLKPGDRVEVTYREGKYTGTIWSAEIK